MPRTSSSANFGKFTLLNERKHLTNLSEGFGVFKRRYSIHNLLSFSAKGTSRRCCQRRVPPSASSFLGCGSAAFRVSSHIYRKYIWCVKRVARFFEPTRFGAASALNRNTFLRKLIFRYLVYAEKETAVSFYLAALARIERAASLLHARRARTCRGRARCRERRDEPSRVVLISQGASLCSLSSPCSSTSSSQGKGAVWHRRFPPSLV